MKNTYVYVLMMLFAVPAYGRIITSADGYQFVTALGTRNSFISIVRKMSEVYSPIDDNDPLANKEGLYIVKQKKGYFMHEQKIQAYSVFDALGASIVESVGFPGNDIWIIPANLEFPGKHFSKRAATLHSFIKAVPTLKSRMFNGVQVNQMTLATESTRRGLRLEVVKSMPAHSDLPMLCAIDTYVGNDDRCCNNLVYDAESDHFFAFDFTEAFTAPLCKLAMKRLKEMDVKILNPYDKESLIAYRNSLLTILTRNSPSKLFKRIDTFVKEMFGDSKITWTTWFMLNDRKRFIKKSYYECLDLIAVLNGIIKQF